MPEAGLKELLEAGVHFGHQTRRWNPNMRRYIFGELDGIHIIDLVQTEALLENARVFAGELASGGGTVLFVGTKKQARGPVKEWADRCKMPYVNQRWLGGLLTNFNTISARIARLHELTEWQEEGKLELLPTKERMGMQAELAKLEYNLGGVRDMDRLPDAVFVTDLKTEEIAVREAARLRIPIIGLVDTNCDPTPVDYVIPGNDDAIRSCQLVIGTIGGAIETGAGAWRVQEETPHRRGDGAAAQGGGRAQEARGGREERAWRPRRPPKKPRRPSRRAGRGSCRRGGAPSSQAAGDARTSTPPAAPAPKARGPRPLRQPAPGRAPAARCRPSCGRAAPADSERGGGLMSVTAADVKALRDRTGAAMMDCKAALSRGRRATSTGRSRSSASRARPRPPSAKGRGTDEGVVASYIHANDKVGAMVEVQCETDFVARNEDFKAFAYEVALHVAATAPRYVSSEEIPEEEREAETRVFEEKAREEGKPDDVVEKIVEGQLSKWASEVALLDQAHVNAEKHDSKSIEELRQELAAKTGENVRVARFAYFRVGEE